MPCRSILICSILETSRTNKQLRKQRIRRDKLRRIRRIEPSDYIILSKHHMVDIARICHASQPTPNARNLKSIARTVKLSVVWLDEGGMCADIIRPFWCFDVAFPGRRNATHTIIWITKRQTNTNPSIKSGTLSKSHIILRQDSSILLVNGG